MSVLPFLTAVLATIGGPPSQGVALALKADGEYFRAGDSVRFTLQIRTEKAAEIPAGWLSGEGWEVLAAVGGGKGKAVSLTAEAGEESGALKLPAGAKLEVTLPFKAGDLLARVGRKAEAGRIVDLEVRLTGREGVSTSIKVVGPVTKEDLPQLDLAKTRVALVTNFGTMVVGFRPDKAPNTVANFVKLAAEGFYDGTKFHRVIPGFMIQGGDPNTKNDDPADDGLGGPGYSIDAEFNDLKHERGVISMARSQDPNSAGSQFFICHARAAHLDGHYTAFGKLVSGLDTLDRICRVPLEKSPGGELSRPKEPVVLRRAIVLPVRK